MNQEQRRFLKERIRDLRFRAYHTDEDDTDHIKHLRQMIKIRVDAVNEFEDRCTNYRRKIELNLLKEKRNALELIYGNDYKAALEAVKQVEVAFEKAQKLKFGDLL